MKAESTKIKPLFLMFLVMGYIHGSILLLSLVDASMKQDTWMVVISGFVISVPFIVIYTLIFKKFPGKNLIQIHDIVYGKVIGKIISIGYIVFFVLVFAYNYRQVVQFYSSYIFSETPPIILYIIFGLVCAYAVKKGIGTIARMSLYTVAFAVFSAIITFLLLLGKMEFTNFLPMFEAPVEEYVRSSYIMACIPYCEVFFILMVAPVVTNHKKIGRYTLFGVGFVMLIYLIVMVRITATLGAAGPLYSESSFESVRLIDLGEFLTRMELIVALVLLTSMFIKTSVLQFAAVKSIAQLLKLKTYNPLVLPFVGIGIVLSMIAYDSGMEYVDFADYHVVFAAPFEFVLPPLTLLLAHIRKTSQLGETAQ